MITGWTATREARFWAKVDKSQLVTPNRPDLGPCWVWTAAVWGGGYGIFAYRIDGHQYRHCAHRLAYELARGPIPEGLELDHLCRVRRCVNPSHLEPVTGRVNMLRSESPFAKKARQTHCLAGHPFNSANTSVTRNGTRHCNVCRDIRRRAAYAATICACGCGQQTLTGVRFRRGHNRTTRYARAA